MFPDLLLYVGQDLIKSERRGSDVKGQMLLRCSESSLNPWALVLEALKELFDRGGEELEFFV